MVGQNSASPDVKSGVCEMANLQGKAEPYRTASGEAAGTSGRVGWADSIFSHLVRYPGQISH
jgi:hypothetical protein